MKAGYLFVQKGPVTVTYRLMSDLKTGDPIPEQVTVKERLSNPERVFKEFRDFSEYWLAYLWQRLTRSSKDHMRRP